MNSENIDTRTHEMQTLNASQMVALLDSVNRRLVELNSYLSDHFIDLSHNLYSYNNYVRTIRMNTDVILENRDKTDLLALVNSLTAVYSAIKKELEMFGATLGENVDLLESLSVRLHNLYESLAKYNESVAGLRYHLLMDNRHTPQGKNENELYAIAQALKAIGASAGAAFNMPVEIIAESAAQLKSFRQIAFDSVEETLINLGNEISGLYDKSRKSETVYRKLATETRHLSKGTDNIVVSLQYHDIVKQKLEHIIEINRVFAEKISSRKSEKIDDSQWLAVITASAQLKIQLLELANTECQEAVCNIAANLRAILSAAGNITGSGKAISGSLPLRNKEFYTHVKNQIDRLGLSIGHYVEKNRYLLNKTKKITKLLDEVSNFIGDIETLTKQVTLITGKIELGKQLKGDSPAVAALSLQVNRLLKNGHPVSKSLKKTLAKIDRAGCSINKTVKLTFSDGKMVGNIRYVTGIMSIIVDYLVGESPVIKKKLQENCTIEKKLTDEITTTVAALTSSTKFEQGIKEIISDLEKLICLEPSGACNTEYRELISSMEKIYTMKSERDIHYKIFYYGKSALKPAKKQNSTHVELFKN